MNDDIVNDYEPETGIGRTPYLLALNELEQARWAGRQVDGLDEALAEIDRYDDVSLSEFYQRVLALPAQPGDFEESKLAAIARTLPAMSAPKELIPDLEERIAGAWSGRIIGNMFGKPIEAGWPRDELTTYLTARDSYPMRDYIVIDDMSTAVDEGFPIFEWMPGAELARGRVDRGVRDDDIDYTVLGLHLLERLGPGYTTLDVARAWLQTLPVFQTYTAERVVYQNLVRWIPASEAADVDNPYREWIGALIRADIFGFVCAGQPRRAALLSHADAYLSHRANGIYGEMWAAALVASAFTAADPRSSVEESLRHIPPASRLSREVELVLAQHAAGLSWEQTLDSLEQRYAGMHQVHTLNNAGALVAAVLWGDGDFASTAGLAAQSGLDADSIGATAGAWAGAFTGASGIPSHLIDPLNDRVESAVFGFSDNRISDLVERTLRVRASRGWT